MAAVSTKLAAAFLVPMEKYRPATSESEYLPTPRRIGILRQIPQHLEEPGDCPMNRPIAVRKLTTAMAIPFVSVGRMIEHTGSLRLRNGHGSGMIRFVWNSSPPNGGEFRSGNVTDTPVTGSTAVRGGALPALSDQV